MKPECRNDCVDPLEFPKNIYNRSGLEHIDYRIGTYSDFLESMLRKLNQNAVLANWTYREPDDPGIALLEGAAVIGDILTFYQEHYANEAYLRTANWRESISDLVRLLGYRLSPGVGGKATFAFEVKGNKPVIIPKGFPVKAQLEHVKQPAEFETTQEAITYPELSKFHLYRPSHFPEFNKKVSVFSVETRELEKVGVEINVKDKLMLLDTIENPIESPIKNAQVAVVKKVETQFDRTNITIEGSWRKDRGLSISAFKLDRTFRHFGHNAPYKVITVTDGEPSQTDIYYKRNLGKVTKSIDNATTPTKIDPSFKAHQIPLDSEIDDLSIGNSLIIQGLTKGVIVRIILANKPASMTWGALTGATTLVTLDRKIDRKIDSNNDSNVDIRNLVIYEAVGNNFPLQRERQANDKADGSGLCFFGPLESYTKLNQRRLALQKEDGISTEVQVTTNTEDLSISDPDIKFRYLNVSPNISGLESKFTLEDFDLESPKVIAYGNLVEANQGKTEKEAVLGNGDNRQTFQSFKLPKNPLTYHIAANEVPPEAPELQIYVNNLLWTRVSSFFNRNPKEEIYIVREDAKGDSWVQFGDGKTGKRLPSGLKNVVAKYRSGVGAYGPPKPETTVQAGTRLSNLKKIQLPGIVTGGDGPESGDVARAAAPSKIQSLDRLVSLSDFENEVLAMSGVSKALAAWNLVNNVPSVVIIVLMETGRGKEIEEVRQVLNNYNHCRGPQRFPIKVDKGERLYLYLTVKVAYNPNYRQELVERNIKEALGVSGIKEDGFDSSQGLFALGKRRFGQSEYASRIEGTIQNVAGVRWAEVIGLDSLDESENPRDLSLPSAQNLHPVISCDNKQNNKQSNKQILSLYKNHLTLLPVSVPAQEAC